MVEAAHSGVEKERGDVPDSPRDRQQQGSARETVSPAEVCPGEPSPAGFLPVAVHDEREDKHPDPGDTRQSRHPRQRAERGHVPAREGKPPDRQDARQERRRRSRVPAKRYTPSEHARQQIHASPSTEGDAGDREGRQQWTEQAREVRDVTAFEGCRDPVTPRDGEGEGEE